MKTIAEIRHGNLLRLITEMGSQEAIAAACETSQVYISQLVNKTPDAKNGRPRQIGDAMARKLESGCNKPEGWMDNEPMAYNTHISQVLNIMENMPAYQQEQTLNIVSALALTPRKD